VTGAGSNAYGPNEFLDLPKAAAGDSMCHGCSRRPREPIGGPSHGGAERDLEVHRAHASGVLAEQRRPKSVARLDETIQGRGVDGEQRDVTGGDRVGRAGWSSITPSSPMRELLVDAWRMCVPKKVAAAYEG
jgi:hypothetical protein